MNYEKKYKEALDKARELCAYPTTKPFIKDLQDLFPELAESEDERIRKEFCKDIWTFIPNEKAHKYIAWLEKQGDQKSVDKEYTFKSIPRLLDMIEPTDRAKSYCKKLIDSLQTEGYSVDAKIVGECLKQMNGEKVAMAVMDNEKQDEKKPQRMVSAEAKEALYDKPTDEEMKELLRTEYEKGKADTLSEMKSSWSEEDECNLKCWIAKANYDLQRGNIGRNHELIDWLKSLKDRVQPQPKHKWSIEDERAIAIINNALTESNTPPDDYDKVYDWLESLKKG